MPIQTIAACSSELGQFHEESFSISSVYTDVQLSQEISRLETAVKSWADERDLWYDSGFKKFIEHVNGEPGSPAVMTVLCSNGELARVLDEDLDVDGPPFHEFIFSLGYFCENQNGYMYYFYANDEALNAAFVTYFHWQGVCSLIQPDAGMSTRSFTHTSLPTQASFTA